MRRIFLVLVLVSLLSFGHNVYAQDYFSLNMALEQVESHVDYQNWLKSVNTTEASITAIRDKQKPQLELGGQAVSLMYNLDRQTSTVNVAPSFSFSQRALSGTVLNASLSPSKELATNKDWIVKWSLSLNQTIWPSPKLSADRLNLQNGQSTLAMLEAQRDYILQNARLKIEELYRQAQLVEARVRFSEQNLRVEQTAYQVTLEKVAIGEASDADLITGRLGVLRAEKELEQALANAQNAKKRLVDALEYAEPMSLQPLELDLILNKMYSVVPEEFQLVLEEHPLLLQRLEDIKKAERDRLAAMEVLRPGASLTLSLGEAQNSTDLQFRASVTISYSLLDGNQKKETVDGRTETLESAVLAYEKELAALEQSVQDAYRNLASLARDLEIAELTLAKADLELQAAQKQFVLGTIDLRALERQELQFNQAQLNHLELSFQYDLTVRRLKGGILGDLTGSGGAGR